MDIPAFIRMIRTGNIIGAAKVVKTAHALANVCGKVCPEEVFCQSVCNRSRLDTPVAIRELHFFATQYEWKRGYARTVTFPRKGKSIGIIGAGPAGLGCAFEAVKAGYEVHVYDMRGFGGVPRHSIPGFRLSDEELRSDIEFLSPFFRSHQVPVDARMLEVLRAKHDALFLGIGLGIDKQLAIRGEHLNGVYPVLRFLEAAKSGGGSLTGRRVLVIGGGNVSLDAAATAAQHGAREVTLLYRRSEKEMRVWKSELDEARHRGVHMEFLVSPLEVLGDDRCTGLRCRRNVLSDSLDSSGRPVPVEVPGSDFVLDADMVVIAIGQQIASPLAIHFERTESGFIKVDERFQTSLPGIFAGGDAINGEGTIVQSVAHGKLAARAMDAYISATTGRNPR